MHSYSLRLKLLTVFATSIASSMSIAQVPRHDVLECGLPNGSKFVLESRYLSIPFNLNPRSSKKREPNEAYQVYFVEKWRPKRRLDMELGRETLSSVEQDPRLTQAMEMCMNFGEYKNMIFAGNLVSKLGEKDFKAIRLPKEVAFPSSKEGLTERQIQQYLDADESFISEELTNRLNVMRVVPYPTNRIVLMLSDNTYVSEGAFIATKDHDSKHPVLAVWQTVSYDRGLTWSKPVVTEAAKLYAIGKTLDQQCFFARPVKINGVKIDPTFPSCEK